MLNSARRIHPAWDFEEKMETWNHLLSLFFVVVLIFYCTETCLGEVFPWPMFLGTITQGSKICNGTSSNVGNQDNDGTYEGRVAEFKARYCKSDEWENWMLANKTRYGKAFAASKNLPSIITISFRYETSPINYSPAWSSEAEHLSVFKTMAQGTYPNYNFKFILNGNTSSSYANIIAGTAGTTSYTYGRNIYLYYETIFNHEFSHVMKLPHHYDSTGDIGNGKHMPPGVAQCIMDRNSSLLCSACRTALGIPLDLDDTSAMDAALNDILSRYPDPEEPPGCWLYQC